MFYSFKGLKHFFSFGSNFYERENFPWLERFIWNIHLPRIVFPGKELVKNTILGKYLNCQGWFSLLEKGFSAREVVPCYRRISLIEKGFPTI